MNSPGLTNLADFSILLRNCLSNDPAVRQPSEQKVQELEHANLPELLSLLCDVLADDNQENQTRMIAGIILKNTVVSKSQQRLHELAHRWLMLPSDLRNSVKSKVLSVFQSSSKEARNVASLVIAKLAVIEIPRKQWDDAIDTLLGMVHSANMEQISASALDTIGYIGDEIPSHLSPHSSKILTVIAASLLSTGTPPLQRLAAIRALFSSLEFSKNNMNNSVERKSITDMIFSSTTNEEESVRIVAYGCLGKLASSYYEYLIETIERIYQITVQAIKTDSENVALQALEFWSTVADVELEISSEIKIAMEKNESSSQKLHNIIKSILPHLFPILFECLTKQSSTPGDDTWDISHSAGTCLSLCAQVVSDDIVDFVLPYITEHIQNPDWKFRDAATIVFGSILQGPSETKMVPLVNQAFPVILSLINDQSPNVRDSAIWTIGRICENTPLSLSEDMIRQLMAAFIYCLKQESRIAALTCWAMVNFVSKIAPQYRDSPSSPLSAYFQDLISTLLFVVERDDSDEHSLLQSAYETIGVLIVNSSDDVLPLVQQLFPVVLQKLHDALQSQASDLDHKFEVQALLCSLLLAIIPKQSEQVISANADNLMVMLLQALKSNSPLVYEEAFLVVGVLCRMISSDFMKYMGEFKPYLLGALSNLQAQDVNRVAVGVVSDLAYGMGRQISPFCDEIMTIFLQNLQSQALDRRVKPSIISAIGDIAMAVSSFFLRYLTYVMMLLSQAALTQMDDESADNAEFVNELRKSILDTITSLVTGLAEDGKASDFSPYLENTISLLRLVSTDLSMMDEEVIQSSLGVIGDLAINLGSPGLSSFRDAALSNLIAFGLTYPESSQMHESAAFAKNSLNQIGIQL